MKNKRRMLYVGLLLILFSLSLVQTTIKDPQSLIYFSKLTGLPVVLKETSSVMEFAVTAEKSQVVSIFVPESEYTSKFSLNLGKEFNDPTRNDWWLRVYAELNKLYEHDQGRGDNKYSTTHLYVNGAEETDSKSIHSMPTLGWVTQNVTYAVHEPVIHLSYLLPRGNEYGLFRISSEEEYTRFNESSDGYVPHVKVGDTESWWYWEVFPAWGYETRYMEQLDIERENRLLFSSPGGFVFFELPDELLKIKAAELEENFSVPIQRKIFQPVWIWN